MEKAKVLQAVQPNGNFDFRFIEETLSYKLHQIWKRAKCLTFKQGNLKRNNRISEFPAKIHISLNI